MAHIFNHRHASIGGTRSHRAPISSEHDLANPSFEVTPHYWVSRDEVLEKLSPYNRSWIMGWRDVTDARASARTVIAFALPLSGVGHTVPLFFTTQSAKLQSCLLANLNSIALDYVARQKVGGLHLTYSYLKQLPILPPRAYSGAALDFIVPRVLELSYTSHSMSPFARDLGYEGPPFAWDEDGRAQLRADLDAWYALAYGLSRDELRYVLDPKEVMGAEYPSETFRVLQKSEISKYGEYRTARLVIAAYDRLVSEGISARTEGYR